MHKQIIMEKLDQSVELSDNDKAWKEFADAEAEEYKKYKKLLKGLINVTGLYRHLDEDFTSWTIHGIVDIILTDEKFGSHPNYQCARIVDDKNKILYMKVSADGEVRGVKHYFIWQRTGTMEDDYYGYILFPLKNGKFFHISYSC